VQCNAGSIDAAVLKMIENFGSGETPKHFALCAVVSGPTPRDLKQKAMTVGETASHLCSCYVRSHFHRTDLASRL
jgi:hypothetical protein